jgi:hypothetical protein
VKYGQRNFNVNDVNTWEMGINEKNKFDRF